MNDTRVMDVFHSLEYDSHEVRSVTGDGETDLRTGFMTNKLTLRSSCPWHISGRTVHRRYKDRSISRGYGQSSHTLSRGKEGSGR